MEVLRYTCLAPHVTAFSTTRGSLAQGPYDGFNINPYCGDVDEHVAACRKELCAWLGIEEENLVVPRQVHGSIVANVDSNDSLEGVDAVMTSRRGVCIGVSTADCIPVLLHDTRHDAVCAIHSGWRGTVRHITATALEAMGREYGTKREDVGAVIGPGIRLDAFEVGDEVCDAFIEAGFHNVSQHIDGRWHINLVEAVKSDLDGVASIHDCGVCTHGQYKCFFSARRLGINSGRIYSGIILH